MTKLIDVGSLIYSNMIVNYGDIFIPLKDISDATTVDAVPVSYIRKWIENHPTDYTTVESMLTDWREEGDSNAND